MKERLKKIAGSPVALDAICMVLIFALAAAMRAVRWAHELHLHRDSVIYLNEMRFLMDGHSFGEMLEHFVFIWEYPVPLFILRLPAMLGADLEHGAISLSIFIGSCWAVMMYRLMYSLYPRRGAAVGAGVIAALHPLAVKLSASVLRDIPYLFFTTLTVQLMIYALRGGGKRRFYYAATGLSAAAALLCRAEAMELPMILVLGLAASKLILPKREFEQVDMRGILLCFASWAVGVVVIGFLLGIDAAVFWGFVKTVWRKLYPVGL